MNSRLILLLLWGVIVLTGACGARSEQSNRISSKKMAVEGSPSSGLSEGVVEKLHKTSYKLKQPSTKQGRIRPKKSPAALQQLIAKQQAYLQAVEQKKNGEWKTLGIDEQKRTQRRLKHAMIYGETKTPRELLGGTPQ